MSLLTKLPMLLTLAIHSILIVFIIVVQVSCIFKVAERLIAKMGSSISLELGAFGDRVDEPEAFGPIFQYNDLLSS